MPFKIVRNDITKVKADAIVNTANPNPICGSGTDLAIYEAAGKEQLLAERSKIGKIVRGEIVVTGAYNLNAKYIIHVVGPVWEDGAHREFEILESCYHKSLEKAVESVDELLGVPEIAGTQEIEIGRIHSFPNHPFKVLDDEKMDTLVDSIRENGILNPVIVRPDQSGNYEMISGHRRLHAAKIVGLKKVPAIVKEMSDDEAIIKMVDANIQREEILPSERAFSLKMKMDAMRRQGARVDIDGTCGNDCHKSGIKTADIVGDTVGLKGRQVRNYVRLTYLIPEVLEMVDQGKIQFVPAVDLSYLDDQVQKWVFEYVKENGFLKPVQVEALKNYPNLSNVTQFSVISIMNDALPKKSKESKLSFSAKKLDKYFPPQYTTKERENIIIQLLEQWSADQVQSE